MKTTFWDDQRAERVGKQLIKNLEERIKICDELTAHELPLPCFTRRMMQRLTENENQLDELISETVMDLLNERKNA